MTRRSRDTTPEQLWKHSVQALVTTEVNDAVTRKAEKMGLSRNAFARQVIEQAVSDELLPELSAAAS